MKSGIALRSAIVAPNEIVKLSKVIDQSGVSYLFLPDTGTFDPLEISASSLGVSKGLLIGSGVIRLLEHDPSQLLRRIQTLQALSKNRFVFGVGVGSPGVDPRKSVDSLLNRLDELRQAFPSDGEIRFPKTFVGALKMGIASRSIKESYGILLNFCSSKYAKDLVEALPHENGQSAEIACYLKIFYSTSSVDAKRLMIEEFSRYDLIPHYHKMFELDGVSDDIKMAKLALSNSAEVDAPESLMQICPTNPSSENLKNYVSKYRNARITIPVVYPYFSSECDYEFKLSVIRSIVGALTEI